MLSFGKFFRFKNLSNSVAATSDAMAQINLKTIGFYFSVELTILSNFMEIESKLHPIACMGMRAIPQVVEIA